MAETPVFICVPLRPSGNLELNIPGVGVLQSVKSTVDGLPTPMSLAMNLLAQANPVISPFIPLLRLVDLAGTILQSFKDVTNPTALAKDIDKLTKEVGFLTEFIPGVPYVRTIRDMLIVVEAILSGVATLLTRWVTEMQAISQALENAALLHDADLQFSATCASQRLIETQNATQASLGDVGQFLKLIKLLSDIISSSVPIKLPGISQVNDTIDTLVTGLASDPGKIGDALEQARLLKVADELQSLAKIIHELVALVTDIIG